MQNPDIARLFDEVADLLEIQDANPFRVRAYRNAARTIRDFPGQAESSRSECGDEHGDLSSRRERDLGCEEVPVVMDLPLPEQRLQDLDVLAQVGQRRPHLYPVDALGQLS